MVMSSGGCKKRVCIVGGGPGGLVALRRVLDSPDLTGTVFEQKDDVGGIWNYKGEKIFATSPRNLTPGKTLEEDPETNTTMYDNLICNLPYPLLEFLDFKHPPSQATFPSQENIMKYFQDYATHFNLWPHIKLNTTVVDIRPENPKAREGEPGRWIVETHNHKDNILEQNIFDAVIIGSGKNIHPYEPKIPGLETFKGKVIHCKFFKNADEFEGKNVVAIGLGPSLADLVLILSKKAKNVTLCHKFPLGIKFGMLPSNVREMKNVKQVTENGITNEDDEKVPCDAIILCTGYSVKFPFMNSECGVEVIEEKYVPHLFKMTVFTKRPTLFILNMCVRGNVASIEVQARFAVKVLEGQVKLPSYEEMEAVLKADEDVKRKLNLPYSIWHQNGEFGAGNWQYFMDLAEEIGINTKVEYRQWPLLQKLQRAVVSRIFGQLTLYRNDVLKMVDDNTWQLILHSDPESPDSKPEVITMILNPDRTVTVETSEIKA